MTGGTVGTVGTVTRPRSLGHNNVTVVKRKVKRRRKTRSSDHHLTDVCSLTGLKKYCDLRGERYHKYIWRHLFEDIY